MQDNNLQYPKQQLTIAGNRFSKRFFDEILPTLSPQDVQRLEASHKYFYVTFNKKWDQILKHLEKSQCETFVAHRKPSEKSLDLSIIICVKAVQFRCLKHLLLRHQKIRSIEALAFMRMQMLEKIDLSSNYITSIKAFNKVNWPNLEQMAMGFNLWQLSDAGRIFSDKLKKWDQIQGQNPVRLVKLKQSSDQQLRVYEGVFIVYCSSISLQLQKVFKERNILYPRSLAEI